MRRHGICTLFLVALAFAFWLFAPTGEAAARGKGGHWEKWWRSPQLVQELKLNPEEQRRLDEMLMDMRRKEIEKRGKIDKLRMEMDAIMDKKVVDDRALRLKTQEAAKLRADITEDRYQFLIKVRKLLGNERYQQLKQLYEKRKKN